VLLHDVYKDRLYQFGVLAAVGFSPFHLLALILGTALIIAIAGVASGFLLAAVFSPRHFEMPSLLANIGAVTPRFDGVVVAVAVIAALAAILAGVVRTVWILVRGPVALTLRKDGG
jgi:ABC-type antimicrobial peptide transport system permease subunit